MIDPRTVFTLLFFKKNPNVIGAWVGGLTAGLVLQRNGYQVKIIAEHWLGDLSINYTSPWAGAYARPDLFNERNRSKSLDLNNSLLLSNFLYIS